MSFANIIGELLQQGMASQSRTRIEQATGPAGLGGLGNLGGLEQILGTMLGGAQGGRAAGTGSATGGGLGGALGGLGGLLDLAQGALGGGAKAGGGGLGSLAGVLLGGQRGNGRGGAGNSAMALLATLALSALQNWQQSQAGAARFAASPADVAALTSGDTERLVLRAMIAAAKADGHIDDSEIARIVDRIDDDGVSSEEKRFVQDELQAPLDLGALIAAVPDVRVGAQLYAASLLAIDLDTAAERDYLRALASGLGLDAGTVARLHQMTGAPALA